jgi:MFS superfamily sulfate permease-like transporter
MQIRSYCSRLFPQPLRNAVLPPFTAAQWKKFFFVHLPILNWLWNYRPKMLIGDIVAGITIGVTHVPQGIGFALLASLPPVFGLYSSFVPVLLYSFLGTSQHISVGK